MVHFVPKVTLELRLGDKIHYYIPNSIAGSDGSLATAVITGVRPTEEYPLSLTTSHLLPHHHNVAKGTSRFNQMSTYTLIPGGDGRYSDAIIKAAGSFSRSMTKKKRKLKEDANSAGFGFAPMDLLL